MQKSSYKVIQWASGVVGKVAIRHFIENDHFDLVGLWVTSPDKIGRDAASLVGLPDIGVKATNDIDALLSLEADCVHYSPLKADFDLVCRMLKSGKNVVSPSLFWYPSEHFTEQYEQLQAACEEGGTSFHGSGIHPGFAGDIYALTTARLMNRVDCIHLHEVINYGDGPFHYIQPMGFGQTEQDFRERPARGDHVMYVFAQGMAMLVAGLGKKIEKLVPAVEVRLAKEDITYPGGVIKKGTVAAQHFSWEAHVDGAPLVVYHGYWAMGADIEPAWDCRDSKYRIIIEGDPKTEVCLQGALLRNGKRDNPGLTWTAMSGVTAIPTVCEAEVGVVTHLDLGVVQPQGLVRRS